MMDLARCSLLGACDRGECLLGRAFSPEWNPLLNLDALGFFLYWIITASGIFLFIFYDTDVHGAYASLEYVSRDQWYAASVMRSLHRYAYDALVAIMILHLLREFARDRYRGVRWFSWVTGVPALVLLFVAGITGYWMVWDTLAQYIALVTTEWRAGEFGEGLVRQALQDQGCAIAPDARRIGWLRGRCMTAEEHPETAARAQFRAAMARIDAANSQDPRQAASAGVAVPYELLYSRRMSEMLEQFRPGASEALKLAVHAQHIQRWRIPRSQFPEGKAGYYRWRNALKIHHAETVGSILVECGYEADKIARIQSLIRKENLAQDAEAQALEDVACLVFLEHYFADFAEKHDEVKLAGILRQTWAKMSADARRCALTLAFEPQARRLLEHALQATAQ